MTVEGSIKNGVIKIDKLNLGSNRDELSAKVTGQFDFRLIAAGGAVRPQPGAFDFGIELDVQPGGERKLGTYWSLLESQIEKFKRAGPEGRKSFAFRVSAPTMGALPTIAPLNR